MKRSGFTMTEVLVVILIIAVVAAITFPAFVQAKGSANKVVCASNMHQLYLAAKLYQSDHGDYPCTLPFKPFMDYCKVEFHCPNSRNKDRPDLRASDYLLLGQPAMASGPLVTIDSAVAALQECRQLRNGEIPLVFDSNHKSKLIVPSDQQSKFYIVREAGNFSVVPGVIVYNKKDVCNTNQLVDYYNY